MNSQMVLNDFSFKIDKPCARLDQSLFRIHISNHFVLDQTYNSGFVKDTNHISKETEMF